MIVTIDQNNNTGLIFERYLGKNLKEYMIEHLMDDSINTIFIFDLAK